jgi:hypothetical protein
MPPHPVSTNQAGRLAVTNSVRTGPCRPAFSSAPVTATPRAWPTWRLADAMPAARPAWLPGMAETAAWLICPSTMPRPTPNSVNAAMR